MAADLKFLTYFPLLQPLGGHSVVVCWVQGLVLTQGG